ncbi:unnamed protein product [Mucor hiemalis]
MWQECKKKLPFIRTNIKCRNVFFLKSLEEKNESNTKQGAIPLSKSNPDLVNGIPLSGEDYLLVVRKQASQCAKTVVAPPPKVIKKVQLPAHFQFFSDDAQNTSKDRASEIWKKSYTASFVSYQKFMQNSKKSKETHKEITSIEEAYKILYIQSEQKSSIAPTLSQHSILRLLKYHIDWLNSKDNVDDQLLCIFHLLLYLDPVLTSKNISILRDLSRECISLRSSKLSSSIAPLNIIICIISTAFGQSDLV